MDGSEDPVVYLPPERVMSPCVRTCRLDQATGWCEGCLRTGDEIARWPDASDAERRAVLARLDQRRVAISKPAG